MPDLKNNLSVVQSRIAKAESASGRATGSVKLIAVSKSVPVEKIQAVVDSGQRTFGESYIQEAVEKIIKLNALNLEWHFIGPIQSNKTKQIAEHFSWVHSIDRAKTAQRLSAQRPQDYPPLNVCIQVNVSGEHTKSGVAPEDCLPLAREILLCHALKLRGLMAIPQETDDVSQQRAQFRLLANSLLALNKDLNLQLDTLSMGMSGDLESAIEEGATFVRVGTDIFGQRTAFVH